jgi:hypothetical protein
VALQDNSENESKQYNWATGLTALTITSDQAPATYDSVRTMTGAGGTILTSGGSKLAYANMASWGFYFPNGAPGISMDAVGQTGTSVGGHVVLVTAEGANTGGAWIKTDKNDYAPGTTVVMTGGGFQAGESIRITLHEDPLVHEDRSFTATADGSGNFTFTGFAPEPHDFGVRFVLTAVGQVSRNRAQTTFTDAGRLTLEFQGTGAGVVSSSTGTPSQCNATCVITVGNSGSFDLTATSGDGSAFGGWSTTGCDATNGAVCTTRLNGQNVNRTVIVTFTKSTTKKATVTLGNLSRAYGAPNPTSGFTVASTSGFAGADQPTCANYTIAATATATAAASSEHGITATCTATGYEITVVPGALTVTKAQLAVNAPSATKTYGDADPTNLTPTFSGFVNGETAAAGLTGSASCSVSGTAITCVPSNLAATNYAFVQGAAGTLTVNARPITVKARDVATTYGTAPVYSLELASGSTLATGDNLASLGTPVFTPAALTVANSPHAITVSGLSNANYTISYAQGDARGKLTVTARPVTVAADAKTKVYGESDPALSYQLTSGSLVAGDAFTGSLTRAMGTGVGTYAIEQGTLALNTNYNLTYVPANLTVTPKALTIVASSVAAASKVYDGTNSAIASGMLAGVIGTENVTLAVSGATFADANVGEGKTVTLPLAGLSLGGTAAGNYTLTKPATAPTATANITPVVVTAANVTVNTKEYDGTTTATFKSGDVIGVLATDKASVALALGSTGSASFTTADAGPNKAATVTGLALTGTAASNYSLGQNTIAQATGEITKATLTIKAVDATREYGDANPAFTGTVVSGAKNNESFTVGGTTTATPTSSVGDYAIVPSASGSTVGNYILVPQDGKLTVTQATGVFSALLAPAITYGATSATVSGKLLSSKGSLPATGDITVSIAGTGGVLTRTATLTAAGAFTAEVQGTNVLQGNSTGYGITVSYLATQNFKGANDASLKLVVNKANQTITFNAISDVVNGAAAFQVAPSASSNLPVALSVSGDCTLTGTTVTPKQLAARASGRCSVTAAQVGDGNYNAAPEVVRSFAITANAEPVVGTITLTANGQLVTGPLPKGTVVKLTASFTDADIPESKDYKVVVNWDDGSAPETLTPVMSAPGAFTINHTFNTAAVATVVVAVTDKINTTATGAMIGTAANYVVIYDPQGGFVTGGGWITAAEGSCVSTFLPTGVCATATGGRANFGFVAKYQRGTTTPTGNTEFQFKAGNLNFNSTSYEWLVVAGSRAQYKGSGTVNGQSGYTFLLTAIDSDVNGGGNADAFRIKIMKNGATVFDNKMGSAEDSDAATVLGGGSIVIHTK